MDEKNRTGEPQISICDFPKAEFPFGTPRPLICTKCGRIADNKSNFCTECGQELFRQGKKGLILVGAVFGGFPKL